MPLPPELRPTILSDGEMARELALICDCGGRVTGTESERRATDLLAALGEAATGVPARRERVAYLGWRHEGARLVLSGGEEHTVNPLLQSVATPGEGLALEIVDLGRGTTDDFSRNARDIAGRGVLVRHEHMFVPDTVHRSVKYAMARAHGAAAFLIAGPLTGALVAGSSGREEGPGIPAVGVTPETAALLAKGSNGHARARLFLSASEAPDEAYNLLFDIPGESAGWVVLSAHIDGHAIGESAMDNASGLVAALAVARALRKAGRPAGRGICLAFFNVEEWALTGSRQHVAALGEAERAAIALDVNLDTVAGGRHLTALVSGFSALGPFVRDAAAAEGIQLATHLPLMRNSDHANFADAGIPALRLVAGFGERDAPVRHLLTPADTRDKVSEDELKRAALVAAALTVAARDARPEVVAEWRRRVEMN